MRADIDPVRFEVTRNALVAITEEMTIALRRSAYSTNIKTRNDFSCAYFDRDLRPVAQAFGQPTHLGSQAELVPRAIRLYGIENIGPGDGILSNDPYSGGVHLNDFALISPVFYEGRLYGFVANIAHHVDVGGGSAGSIGAFREVYQEGIIIPPVKLVRANEIVPDVFNLIVAQIRSKRETAGDLRAQVAANNTGVRRLSALLGQLGPETFNLYVDELIEYTEERTRAELARLPRGVLWADGYVDNDGFTDQPVHLVSRITIDDAGVLFDFTGCDRQRPAPVDSTWTMTFAACAYVLKCLIDPDVPVNAGFYRCVRMIAPPGTVVNCTHPAPVVGGWETQTRLVDVMLKAFSAIAPELTPAGTKAMMAQVAFGGVDRRHGDLFAFYEALAGGYGGRATKDGPDAVQAHGQNTQNAPIEEVEANYPVRIDRYELVEDSDGPGKHRGGLGLRRDYLFPDVEVSFSILSDRDRWGPWGLFGGLPGEKAHYILNPKGEAVALGSKTTVHLKAGDLVSYRTCGGGGYGPPWERDPQLVLRDARDGKVSAERARQFYGVVIEPAMWSINEPETAALRAELLRAAGGQKE